MHTYICNKKGYIFSYYFDDRCKALVLQNCNEYCHHKPSIHNIINNNNNMALHCLENIYHMYHVLSQFLYVNKLINSNQFIDKE